MNDALKIFVDADAFVALAREDDTNHERAISCLQNLLKQSVVFITSNYVFSESITVISMLKSHEAAVQFIEAMQSPESQYLLAYVERTNLTSRHMNGRLVRKTLSFSKELRFLEAASCWEDALYNFTRPVKT